ncbi:hypothetical protein, partial [Shewanella sp. T24-MNA-CIBAN-0130]|uniref:DUF7146 domain-containing protein n=1 Tax=Shewanella sp. T24-MNA-CIBAN-0130 TaxID=3140470 RepID=UPI00332836AC
SLPAVKPNPIVKPKQQSTDGRYRYLKQFIQKGKPLQLFERNPVTQYMINRGLGSLIERGEEPDNLYYAKDVLYKHYGERSQRFGCLLAALHDVDGNLIGGHRIYLSADGQKAAVSTPKKSLPPIFPGAMNG